MADFYPAANLGGTDGMFAALARQLGLLPTPGLFFGSLAPSLGAGAAQSLLMDPYLSAQNAAGGLPPDWYAGAMLPPGAPGDPAWSLPPPASGVAAVGSPSFAVTEAG